ncbi:fibrinogen-like YCDxxxxGGGW domain-containing protein [Sorangium sp. So ce1182]|uniref:fibrinogen-like YCDxxxxGGGW domain-containing protein n=1 Tax=Sorangium sp. So ce1182 TaxID=3133334 RepID=UPI003F6062FB
MPETQELCYDGPPSTASAGACKTGIRTCNDEGTGYGPCEGQVQPADELCDTPVDESCDGRVNEGCVYPSCASVPAGSPSGVYLADPGAAGATEPAAIYCDMEVDGGGWTLLYSSIGSDEGTTMAFWDIPYLQRFSSKGEPSVDTNVYVGWLYLHGTEYRDEVEDSEGKVAQLFHARTTGVAPDTLRFKDPEIVSGDSDIYNAQFAAGWSSPDFDADTWTENCSAKYSRVTQHYGGCWVYNLGSDADSPVDDDGWGPHLHAPAARRLGLAADESGYTRVRRISRWVRW